MKKTMLALAAIAGISMLFMGCPKSTSGTSDPAGNEPEGSGVDLLVWEAEDLDNGTLFKTKSWDTYLELPEAIDLTGYKYLSIEVKIPDTKGCNIVLQPKGEKEPDAKGEGVWGHQQGNIMAKQSKDFAVYQTSFGPAFGTGTYYVNGNKVNKKIEDSMIGSVQLYAQSTATWDPVDNVEFYVKRIWATNTRNSKAPVLDPDDVPETPVETEIVLLDEEVVIGTSWSADERGEIAKEDFVEFTTDTEITFIYTLGTAEGYSQLKIMDGSWAVLQDLEGVNEWGTIDLPNPSTEYTIKLSEDDLALVKESGIIFTGFNVTVTKVVAK